MDPRGSRKGYAQLITHNDFFAIYQTSILSNKEITKVLQSASEYLYVSFEKKHHTAKAHDPITSFLAPSFTQKMPESSDSMCSSVFMLENIWYPKVDQIYKKL